MTFDFLVEIFTVFQKNMLEYYIFRIVSVELVDIFSSITVSGTSWILLRKIIYLRMVEPDPDGSQHYLEHQIDHVDEDERLLALPVGIS